MDIHKRTKKLANQRICCQLAMQGILNTTMGEVTEKDDSLEAMVSAFKEQTEEFNIFKVALSNGVLVVAPMPKVDVSESKEFNGTRFTKDVGNFLWGMKQYFCTKSIMNDATKVNIVTMYFTDVVLLWWHHRSTVER